MSDLAQVSIILGFALSLFYVPMIVFPSGSREWGKRFPRHKWAGRVLSAIFVVWAVWRLSHTPLSFFEPYKVSLYALGPAVYLLAIFFMDEMLAVRALGALMCLPVASELITAARWHESSLRHIVMVIAYIIVVKGMVLVFNPYKFRTAVERFFGKDSHIVAGGCVGLAMCLLLLVLGFRVY